MEVKINREKFQLIACLLTSADKMGEDFLSHCTVLCASFFIQLARMERPSVNVELPVRQPAQTGFPPVSRSVWQAASALRVSSGPPLEAASIPIGVQSSISFSFLLGNIN